MNIHTCILTVLLSGTALIVRGQAAEKISINCQDIPAIGKGTEISSFQIGESKILRVKSCDDPTRTPIVTINGTEVKSTPDAKQGFIDFDITAALQNGPADGTIGVKLANGKNAAPPQDVKFKEAVLDGGDGNAGGGQECYCLPQTPTKLDVSKDCNKWTVAKNFGIDVSQLVPGKEIYTLDFATKTYYLTTKDGNTPKTRAVNMNRIWFNPRNDVSFRIVNVNLFMNSAKIQDSIVTFENEPPFLLRQLFFPDSAASVGILNRWSTSVAATNAALAVSSQGGKKGSYKTSPVECFLNCYYSLKATVLAAYNPCSNFPCCGEIADRYQEMMVSYSNIVGTIDSAAIVRKVKQDELSGVEKELDDCEKAKSATSQALAAVKKLEDANTAVTEEAMKKAKADAEKAKTAEQSACKNAQNSEARRDKLKVDIADLNKLVALKATLTALEPSIANMTVFVNNIVRQNQEIYQDVSVAGNRTDIYIEVRTKDSIANLFGLPRTTYTRRLEIPVLWKPMVTFGTGTFGGLSDEFQNRIYNWQEIPDVNNNLGTGGTATRYQLVNSGTAARPVGFTALANVHLRATRTFGFGASIGAGLTIEKDPRLTYLGGPSLFFGDVRQLGVTFGWAAMKVNQLQPAYQYIVDNSVLSNSASATVGYYQKLVTGYFVAVTYTPLKSFKR